MFLPGRAVKRIYWIITTEKPKDEILLDGPEGRPWPFNGQRPSNKVGIALIGED